MIAMGPRPNVVTICGSVRFYPQMLVAAQERTVRGDIVLMPFVTVVPNGQSDDLKKMLDELHFQKIDLADEILVVTDQNGYLGDSTRREMGYALSAGKRMFVREFRLFEEEDAPSLATRAPGEVDPVLLALLADAGDKWGPLGVALSAARMSDVKVLMSRLEEEGAIGG